MTQRTQLSDALTRLESAMRAAGIWSQERPRPEAFLSQEPFAIDTMGMSAWLRFIFVPRLRMMLAEGRALPQQCSVAPAAQVYLPKMTEGARVPVLMMLQEIDEIITNGEEDQDEVVH